MSRYDIGEKIRELSQTLGRSPSKEQNVSSNINLDGQKLEHGQIYAFKCLVLGSGDKALVDDTFIGEVHDSNKSVTIPVDFVRENDLKPGHSLKVKIYEVSEQNDQEPEQTQLAEDDRKWEYVSTATVISDSCASDGCDSRFSNSTLYERLNGKTDAKLVNTRNGETTTTKLKPLSRSDVSFHMADRKTLNAKPQDSINVYLPRIDESEPAGMPDLSQFDGENRAEKIDIMYKILRELHTAYKEGQMDD